MPTEYVYYARKVGAEEWEEELMATRAEAMSPEEMTKMKSWLQENGYDITTVREAVYGDEAPDFTKVFN
jgi:hypothetical protein